MVLGRDLQDGRGRSGVTVDGVADQFGHILVDEDDVDVVALDELLEAVLDVGYGSVWS